MTHCIVAILAVVIAFCIQRQEYTATITRVIDGDTIVCTDSAGVTHTIRIDGYDTFEKRNGKRLLRQARASGVSPREALERGKEATVCMERIALRQTVRVQVHGVSYSREVADVYLNGVLLRDYVPDSLKSASISRNKHISRSPLNR